MKIYIVQYCVADTTTFVVYPDSFKLKKDAERTAKQLRACKHKLVQVMTLKLI